VKVLVIGSGPIVIGQAAEFDYAGTQACKALREEGCEVVLLNSNPATIMTDPEMSDALYIEPLTPDFCELVIAKEKPDTLLPTLGGQTGLNLATRLAELGILKKYGVRLLGTPLEAIRKAEDREEFRKLMREIREPVPESFIVESQDQLKAILPEKVPDETGRLVDFPYPRIVRPAYTLGGTGGGIAYGPDELWEIGRRGLALSMRGQVMVERSLLGWKEIEYEVMRDSAGNCITVCNMENFDPMGVHTGDSIVVAPSQTLSDLEYHMLRAASLKIIRALGIEGGCNVQLAVNPESFDYYVIEVNPRVSRSSALASKATGYPIARVAAKIAIGKTLDEIDNQVTGTTKACFEPALDYVVVKIPRWPFDKFRTGDRSLFTQMKATGEVMAIDRTFEAALMKAIRGLEVKQKDLRCAGSTDHLPVRSIGFQPMRTPGFQPGAAADEGIEKREGAKLPHWRREGATYAVVFRLADSVPREVRERWRSEAELLRRKEAHGALPADDLFRLKRLQSEEVRRLLNAGHGSCALRDPKTAQMVRDAMLHFHGTRYRLHAYCVMPNHVHALVEPVGDHELSDILHSWKSFTSNAINRRLSRKGTLWEVESYDHLVRNDADFNRCAEYILRNPQAAGLADWPWVGQPAADAAGHEQDARGTHRLEADATHGQDGRATSDQALQRALQHPTDERLWAIAEAIRRGWGLDEVNRLSRVDIWFLQKIRKLVDLEQRLERAGKEWQKNRDTPANFADLITEASQAGFSAPSILSIMRVDEGEGDDDSVRVRKEIARLGETRVFKMVDTCAGEFESRTPYYYGTFEEEDDTVQSVEALEPAVSST